MILNNENVRLKDLILLKRNFIPKELCEFVIDTIENGSWEKHLWYGNFQENQIQLNDEKEPCIQYSNQYIQDLILPYIIEVKNEYESKVAYKNPPTKLTQNFSYIRFNKYESGNFMDYHIDHINSLFTPPDRGIPILSMIINLNGDYDGGELVFWDNFKFKLSAGDIIIWPSVFLYPHRVNKITKNKRYSGVIWFW